MDTPARPVGTGAPSDTAGNVTLVLGVLFSFSVAVTCVLSLTDLVDPPSWVRGIALAWLPIGLGGVPISYFFARTGPGRRRARIGIGAAMGGLVAFVVLVVALG